MAESTSPDHFTLDVPQMVLQSGMTCWAAAIVSWLTVRRSSPIAWHATTEAGIVKEMRSWNSIHVGLGKPELMHTNDALTKAGVIWLFENARMRGQGFPSAKSITAQYLLNSMKTRGQLLLIRIWPGGMCHALVVYGIRNIGTPECDLFVMDPNKGHVMATVEDLKSDSQLFVCWLSA